jgi:hypothetical protein
MVSAARRFGEAPTARELVDRLMAVVAEQGEAISALVGRLEVLEAKVAGADGEDARSPARPSPPEWLPLPAAVKVTRFSASGLRRRTKHHSNGPRWWQWYAGKVFVHVPTAPRRS